MADDKIDDKIDDKEIHDAFIQQQASIKEVCHSARDSMLEFPNRMYMKFKTENRKEFEKSLTSEMKILMEKKRTYDMYRNKSFNDWMNEPSKKRIKRNPVVEEKNKSNDINSMKKVLSWGFEHKPQIYVKTRGEQKIYIPIGFKTVRYFTSPMGMKNGIGDKNCRYVNTILKSDDNVPLYQVEIIPENRQEEPQTIRSTNGSDIMKAIFKYYPGKQPTAGWSIHQWFYLTPQVAPEIYSYLETLAKNPQNIVKENDIIMFDDDYDAPTTSRSTMFGKPQPWDQLEDEILKEFVDKFRKNGLRIKWECRPPILQKRSRPSCLSRLRRLRLKKNK